MHGTIGTLWERRETDQGLPLSVEEIRGAFPFPTMNPIVKDYLPEDMKRKWEGRHLPLWKWSDGDATLLFSASARDMVEYTNTDEFLSLSLPDGRSVLCLLPYGEDLPKSGKKPLLKWLENSGKLRIVKLQPLLTDFLLSASGELTSVPGDLVIVMQQFRDDKEDILLSRKTEIYERALTETVKDELPKPSRIGKGKPPEADTLWGRVQIARTIAVRGIGLAFSNISPEEKLILADLRDLFRGGREGRGAGDLQHLISKRDAPGEGGHTRLPDRLLPYRRRGAALRSTEVVEKLATYWHREELDEIEELARAVSLDDFLKLHQDEDMSRLLEALWRSVRQDFDSEDLDGYAAKLEKMVIPTLKACQGLEVTANEFGLEGVNFGEYGRLVKSLPGFEELLNIIDRARNTSSLTRSIVSVLAESTDDIDGDIRALSNACDNARRAIEGLTTSAEYLRKNFWEYRRAVKFTDLKEVVVKATISDQMTLDGTLTLEGVERRAGEIRERLEEFSASLSELEEKLKELEGFFVKA